MGRGDLNERSDAAHARAAALRAEVEGRREELVELCAELVAAPSVTPPGDTRAAADVAERWLRGRGHQPSRHHLVANMANLIVTVVGARPGPQLIFNGHLDTMDPGEADRWTVPPFELTRRDGRLYGLGMGNMKGADAALCLAFDLVAQRRDELAGSLTLTLVSDEVRFGDHGSKFLLDTIAGLRGDAVISGEGSGWMSLAVAEKGLAWYDLCASGPAGHASAARKGSSAVARLAAALAELDELNDWWLDAPAALGGVLDAPGHPGRRVALNAGIVRAGEARGMLAPQAEALLDVRLPPGLSLDALDARLAAVLEAFDVRFERPRGWEANWTAGDDPLVRSIDRAILAVRGEAAAFTVRHPASDVMRWRALGVPGVCYGPQPTFSAGVDDYANEADVLDCAAVYALCALDYADRLAAPG